MDAAVERLLALIGEESDEDGERRNEREGEVATRGAECASQGGEAGGSRARALVMVDFSVPAHHGRHLGVPASSGQPPVVDVKAFARLVEGAVGVKPRKRFCLVSILSLPIELSYLHNNCYP